MRSDRVATNTSRRKHSSPTMMLSIATMNRIAITSERFRLSNAPTNSETTTVETNSAQIVHSAIDVYKRQIQRIERGNCSHRQEI